MEPTKKEQAKILLAVGVGLLLISVFYLVPLSHKTNPISEVAAANQSSVKAPPFSDKFSVEEKKLVEFSDKIRNLKSDETSPELLKKLSLERQELFEKNNKLSPEALLLSVVGGGDLDQKETITGRLSITFVENFDQPEKAGYVYRLKPEGSTETIELTTIRPLPPMAGAKVSLSGYRLGEYFLLDPETPVITLATPSSLEAVGPQKTLVLLTMFEDSAPVPFSTEEAQNIIFNSQAFNFFNEQSYGRISFYGDVFGWYTVPRNSNCTAPTFGNDGELDDWVLNTVPNLSDYNRVIILSHHGCTFAGFSTIGKDHVNVGGQDYYFSVAQIGRTGSYNQPSIWGTQPFVWTNLDYLLAHELGHSLGLYHANGFDCHEAVLYSDNCENVEYGNFYDVMGIENNSLHYNAFYKERLGWITPEETLIVDRSGQYKMANLESVVGKRMAKVKTQGYNRYPFYLEARRGIGFDSKLQSSGLLGNQAGLFVNKIVNDAIIDTYFEELTVWEDLERRLDKIDK